MNGIELQAWRKAHNMTQPELAELLGVHSMTVSRWERSFHQVPRLVIRLLPTLDQHRGLGDRRKKETRC